MRFLLLFGLAVIGTDAQISYTSGDCVCEDRCRFLSAGCCPPQDCTDSGQGYFPNQPDTPSYYPTNEPENPTYYPPFPSDEWTYYPSVTDGCQNPGSISNGYISSGQANFNVGDNVTYSCRKGYKLEGTSQQVCTSSLVYFLPFSAAPSWVPENKPECKATNPCHLHSCDSHADCVPDYDRVGYTCRCRHGYFGNGYNCKQVFPCDSKPCDPHATCGNVDISRYICKCKDGYRGNGKSCTKIYPCDSPRCHTNAKCENVDDYRFKCTCLLGYRGNGKCCQRTSGSYGNINRVQTTGASLATARQDRLTFGGVRASHTMAKTDSKRMKQYKSLIRQAGRAYNVDPAVIAGIISRESRAGNVLDKNGYGDHGNGFGLMQVDKRSHQPQGGAYSLEHLKQATGILADMIKGVSRKHPTWTAEQKLKGGISAYNAGVGNVRTYERMDVGTTGGDYANDVVARAQWYKANGY